MKNYQRLGIVFGVVFGTLTASYAAQRTDKDFWLYIENDKANAVSTYLQQGTDPNSQSQEEQPAVMWAIQNESWKAYGLFINHPDFEPNQVNGLDETPLMYLAILGDVKRAQQLIDMGAKVNRLGWSPLHYASSKGHVPMATLLLEKGATVNAPAPDGSTPLMMAARSGKRAMVNLLLEQGADPTVRSVTKLTAADWAEANHNTRLAKQLREVATQYAQQRQQHPEQTPVILLGQPAQSSGSSAAPEPKENEDNGSSQYFDLDRF